MAFLSACQSAVRDFERLPDEFIGLPVGLLQAGIPAVIGALWRVDDLSSALMVLKFYEFLLDGSPGIPLPSSARALQMAVQWLRGATHRELATFFETQFRAMQKGEETYLTAESILEGLVRFSAPDEPGKHPFAERPADWAAFVHIGV